MVAQCIGRVRVLEQRQAAPQRVEEARAARVAHRIARPIRRPEQDQQEDESTVEQRSGKRARDCASSTVDEPELRGLDRLLAELSDQRDHGQPEGQDREPYEPARDARVEARERRREAGRETRRERAGRRDRGRQPEQSDELPPEPAARSEDEEQAHEPETHEVQPAGEFEAGSRVGVHRAGGVRVRDARERMGSALR